MNEKLRKALLFFLEIIQITAIALVVVIPIRYFVFQPFVVKGASMEPNFHSGDYLIVDELTYRLRDPKRGEVIVFDYPNDPSQRFIKRIVGLPYETVRIGPGGIEIVKQNGEIEDLDESSYYTGAGSLSGQQIVLGKDEYFVLGDNRAHSFDSRKWGPVAEDDIIGRAVLRAWPLQNIAYFLAPSY